MKNVYQSIDHNSFLYSRVFFNQLIPFIGLVSFMDATASERVVKAKALLQFQTDATINVTEQKASSVDISKVLDQPYTVINVGETIELP